MVLLDLLPNLAKMNWLLDYLKSYLLADFNFIYHLKLLKQRIGNIYPILHDHI